MSARAVAVAFVFHYILIHMYLPAFSAYKLKCKIHTQNKNNVVYDIADSIYQLDLCTNFSVWTKYIYDNKKRIVKDVQSLNAWEVVA